MKANSTDVTISGKTNFLNNTAVKLGGGVSLVFGSLIISGETNNQAIQGGALVILYLLTCNEHSSMNIVVLNGRTPTILHCTWSSAIIRIIFNTMVTFSNNSAYKGGAYLVDNPTLS